MKRVIGLILACLLMLVFTGCAGEEAPVETTATNGTEESTEPSESVEPSESADDEEVELIVFAAASMTETLTQIQEMYKEVAPNVTLTFNFDSSGTLVTQIEEGADCDIFISAAQKQMDEIDSSKGEDVNPEGFDFVEQGTRVDMLSLIHIFLNA